MLKRTFRSVFLSFCLLFIAACNPATESKVIQPDPDWTTGVLENGFKYHIQRMEGEPVELRLLVHAGAYQETLQQYGYAHFLEHMAFNGSKHFNENQVVSLFEEAGLSFGNDLNAFTSFDATSYQLSLPDKTSLDKALLWFRDIGDGLTLDPKQIEMEKGVVLGEIRLSTNNPSIESQIEGVLLQSTILDGYKVLGSNGSIKSINYQQLKQFYDSWYQPNNSEIVIVGDIEPDKAEQKIKQYFKDWKAGQLKQTDTISLSHTTDMTPALIQSPHGKLSSVELIHASGKNRVETTEDQLERFTQSLTYDLISNRLKARIFETSAPVAEHYSGSFGLENIRYGYLSAYFSEQDREKAQQFLAAEISSLISHGVTEVEFETALSVYSEWVENIEIEFRRETSFQRISDKQESLILKQVFQSQQEFKQVLEHFVKQADIDTINQKIRTLLLPEKQKFFFTKSGSITDEEFDNFPVHKQQQVMLSQMSATGKKVEVAAKEVKFPVPKTTGKITAFQEQGDKLFKWTLENGVEVWLKQMPQADNTTYIQYAGMGGKLAMVKEYNPALDVAVPLMSQAGLYTLNGIEFGRFLTKENMYMRPELGLTTQSLYVQADNKHLATAFAVLREAAVNAHVDSVQLESVKNKLANEQRAYLKSSDGQLLARMQAKIYGNDSPYSVTAPEKLEAVTAEQIRAIYQTLFRQNRDFRLVVVSSLPAKEFEGYLRRYVANIPYEAKSATGQRVLLNSGRASVEFKSGSMKSIKHVKVYSTDTQLPVTKDLYLSALIQTLLDTRMIELIREQYGLDYSPRVGTLITDGVSLRELWYAVNLDKNDLAKAKEALKELMTQASTGFTEQELEAAKKQIVTDVENMQDKPVNILRALTRYLLHNYDFQVYLNSEAYMQSITIDDVNQAFRELIADGVMQTEGTVIPEE